MSKPLFWGSFLLTDKGATVTAEMMKAEWGHLDPFLKDFRLKAWGEDP